MNFIRFNHPKQAPLMGVKRSTKISSFLNCIARLSTKSALIGALITGNAEGQQADPRDYSRYKSANWDIQQTPIAEQERLRAATKEEALDTFLAEGTTEGGITKEEGSMGSATIKALIDRARFEEDTGNTQKSLELWQQTAAKSEQLLRGNDQLKGFILASLGRIEFLSGMYEQSLKTKLAALRIYEFNLGSSSLYTAFEYSAIGSIYYTLGQLSKAEEYILKALSVSDKAPGDKARNQHIIALHNLASVHSRQERNAEAEKSYLAVIQIMSTKELDRASSNLLANSYSNLANLYRKLGRSSEVESLYMRAISTANKQDLANLHSQDAFIEALASFYIEQGKSQDAQKLLLAQIKRAAAGDRNKTLVFTALLSTLGTTYTAQKDHQKADMLYAQALELFNKELSDHPDRGHLLLAMAYSKILQIKYQEASAYALEGLDLLFKFARQELPYLNKNRREAFIEELDEQFHEVFSYALKHKEGARIALHVRLNRQGLIQEIERRLRAFLADTGKTFNTQEESTLHQPGPVSTKPSKRLADSSFDISNMTSSQINRDIPDLRIEPVSIKEVADSLPADGAIIEIQKLHAFEAIRQGSQRKGEPEYVALVLKPNANINAVPLGSVAAIDKIIREGLRASAEGNSDAKEIWAKLSNQILRPLLKHLNTSQQWFISPDGELNRVPFSALPAPQQPSLRLSEAIRLRILTTSRELIRFRQAAPAGKRSLVIADPDYDHRITKTQLHNQPKNSLLATQGRFLNLSSPHWSALPGTKPEGQQVANLLGTQALTGIAATSEALKRHQSPLVLHVATHGFFVANEEKSSLQSIQQEQSRLGIPRDYLTQLRSGLVFAGANRSNLNQNDDSYMTAAEAASLNLQGTQLVVLSACSTGQGDLRTGEGLYGLQRSLAVAGARSTLLSLWKVDDAATAEFMTRFYKRLKAGEGRSDALVATQKEFRDGLVKDPKSGLVWNNHYYWAAWQLVGDWRPIPGF